MIKLLYLMFSVTFLGLAIYGLIKGDFEYARFSLMMSMLFQIRAKIEPPKEDDDA